MWSNKLKCAKKKRKHGGMDYENVEESTTINIFIDQEQTIC